MTTRRIAQQPQHSHIWNIQRQNNCATFLEALSARTVTHLTPMLLPRRPKKDDGRGLVLAAAALQDHISRSYKLSNPAPVRKAPVAACSRCGHLPSNEGRRTLPTLSDGLLTGKCKFKACNPMYAKLATSAVQQLFAALAIPL